MPRIMRISFGDEQLVVFPLIWISILRTHKEHLWHEIKVTNEVNGQSVIVEVTDRGPFDKIKEKWSSKGLSWKCKTKALV
jgi:hypothetical protein